MQIISGRLYKCSKEFLESRSESTLAGLREMERIVLVDNTYYHFIEHPEIREEGYTAIIQPGGSGIWFTIVNNSNKHFSEILGEHLKEE